MTGHDDEVLRGELRECSQQIEQLQARRRGPPDDALEQEIQTLERRAAEIIRARADRRLSELRAQTAVARARKLLRRKSA